MNLNLVRVALSIFEGIAIKSPLSHMHIDLSRNSPASKVPNFVKQFRQHLWGSILTLCIVCSACPAYADAASDGGAANETPSPTLEAQIAPNAASDASFDDRLPPVLPGEELNDSGRTTKVWSTSGPVPVGRAPEPWRKGSQVDDLDVIIDGRGVSGLGR